MKTLNLTQHIGMPEQGVVEPKFKKNVQDLLTFEELPTPEQVEDRALKLACIALDQCKKGDRVMIGGAPFLMGPLERKLLQAGLKPVYAFSRREVVEQTQADGVVKKVAVFKHVGFVEVV